MDRSVRIYPTLRGSLRAVIADVLERNVDPGEAFDEVVCHLAGRAEFADLTGLELKAAARALIAAC